ncbi:MAG: hypothetical protein QM490_01475 [Candidatus Gracilibacteria bacterium]
MNIGKSTLGMKVILSSFLMLLLVSCGTDSTNTDTTTDEAKIGTDTSINANKNNTMDRNEEIISLQPKYKNELYGKIKQIEGNMFTISEIDLSKDPTIGMEQAEKKEYMTSLSDADKQALKAQALSAFIGDVKVMIPVGIPMIKKELIGEDKLDLEATLADLQTGDIISIWYNEEITDRKVAKYAKRSMRR